MNQDMELVEYIYQDSEMATFTLEELLKNLKGKENKINKTVENILKGYERYTKEAEALLEKHDTEKKPKGTFSKMSAGMGIKKEVLLDNSDSAIADMLIKGISMGTLDMEKKIDKYQADVQKTTLDFAKKFFAFQKDNIEALKKHI